MTQFTNADKQLRFRKKEQLKKDAEKIFRLWEGSIGKWGQSRSPENVRTALEKAIELPSGWTDEDYEYATKKLGQYHLDLISSVDQISNDIDGDWSTHSNEFRTTSDPLKFIADNKAAKEKARALASHLISALKLSNCEDADQAAALMEAVRYVGLSLVSNREIRCSQATTICLASIGPQYDRPDWFPKKLAETISHHIDEDRAKEVGRYLNKPKN
jgi:hypothetical protein